MEENKVVLLLHRVSRNTMEEVCSLGELLDFETHFSLDLELLLQQRILSQLLDPMENIGFARLGVISNNSYPCCVLRP